MKHLLKVLSLGAAIILSAPFAKADSTNQISFNGFETYCPPTSTTCTAGAVTYASTPVNSLTGGDWYFCRFCRRGDALFQLQLCDSEPSDWFVLRAVHD